MRYDDMGSFWQCPKDKEEEEEKQNYIFKKKCRKKEKKGKTMNIQHICCYIKRQIPMHCNVQYTMLYAYIAESEWICIYYIYLRITISFTHGNGSKVLNFKHKLEYHDWTV